VPTAHSYDIVLTWTGNRGSGTSDYRAYDRSNELAAPGRPVISGSADPAFLGDPARWNPEQLLVAAVSQCHLLSYLYLCATAGVVVTGYTDEATGTMTESADGGGSFTDVVLRPRVRVAQPQMVQAATSLHEAAHRDCFICNSVAFPVRCEPAVVADGGFEA
jgi:organic hydroperoxide reductase OsmC/OhrA